MFIKVGCGVDLTSH
ncbi:hypothetical protein D018_0049A, partial [Vibrio parahaemolyticus VP2007-007]